MYFMEGVQIYIGQCHNHLIVIAQVAVTSTVSGIPSPPSPEYQRSAAPRGRRRRHLRTALTCYGSAQLKRKISDVSVCEKKRPPGVTNILLCRYISSGQTEGRGCVIRDHVQIGRLNPNVLD